jgi:hypothetical protein
MNDKEENETELAVKISTNSEESSSKSEATWDDEPENYNEKKCQEEGD